MCVCARVCVCALSRSQHCSDPERLLLTQRTVAAALHLRACVESSGEPAAYSEEGLARLQTTLFEPVTFLVRA